MRRLLAVLVLVSISAKADVQLADSFDDGSINTAKWDVKLAFADSMISLQNGFIKSINRGILVSRQEFQGSYVVSGSYRGPTFGDIAVISLRTDGGYAPSSLYRQLNGIEVVFRTGGPIEVNEISSGGLTQWVGNNSLPGQIFDFSILDTGSDITVSWNGEQRLVANTSYSVGKKIGFYGREFVPSHFWGETGVTDLFQIQVATIPEPSSLSLLLLGGAVLMAGRRKR